MREKRNSRHQAEGAPGFPWETGKVGLSPKRLPGTELGQCALEGDLSREMLGDELSVFFQQTSECGVGVQRPLDSGFTLLECTRPSGSVCGFGKGRMDLNTVPRSEGRLED